MCRGGSAASVGVGPRDNRPTIWLGWEGSPTHAWTLALCWFPGRCRRPAILFWPPETDNKGCCFQMLNLWWLIMATIVNGIIINNTLACACHYSWDSSITPMNTNKKHWEKPKVWGILPNEEQYSPEWWVRKDRKDWVTGTQRIWVGDWWHLSAECSPGHKNYRSCFSQNQRDTVT